MRRFTYVLLGLVLIVIGTGALLARPTTSQPVYAVPAVRAGVRTNPRAWAGRTILVRGWPTGYARGGCRRPAGPRAPACGRFLAIYLASRPDTGAWPPNELTIAVRPNTSAATITRLTTIGPLDALLNTLNTLGPLCNTLFRWSGSRTLRIRLGPPRPCATQDNTGGPNCSIGVLLNS